MLIILAAVTIYNVAESGLADRAVKSAEEYAEAQEGEKSDMDALDGRLQSLTSQIGKTTGGTVNNSKFENNGIDKTHDGAQYDAVTTEDGMWTIYKDIDTRTRKVNVYVESKYYAPSFEQFVFEKGCLTEFLNVYAMPIYSFSDLSDFYANLLYVQFEASDEYIKQREEEMGVGPFLSDIFEKLGVDEYDAFKEVGKILVDELNGKDVDRSIFKNSESLSLLSEGYGFASEGIRVSELTYDNLLDTYNKLYGDKVNLTISDEEKNKTYKIELPDGKAEEIQGKDLYKARFRYVTTKNGDLQIKITTDGSSEKTITYTGVTNIENCVVNDGDYIYTYNCTPFLDVAATTRDISKQEESCLLYRFNFGGWNVTGKGLYQILNNDEPAHIKSSDKKNVQELCKSSVNGEPVTAMFGTYLGTNLDVDKIIIPDTVKYTFDTFRSGNLSENVSEIILPSVEYASYVLEHCEVSKKISLKVNENIKQFYIGLYGWPSALGKVDGWRGYNSGNGLFSMGIFERYKK